MALLDLLLPRRKHGPADSRAETGVHVDWPARRIEPAADRGGLALSDRQRRVLRQLCAHVRQRSGSGGRWRIFGKRRRHRTTSALFVGASDSDRLIAAGMLAGDLQLDLYRVDLGAIAGKYIGETEENLARVFEAAEDNGAVVLFDEADTLFGKRSEVKDAHDRYANIEVAYLLERVGRLNGLAIFAADMRRNLDPAFLRRLRFTVDFTRPDRNGE
jgi:hypothetical protein